MKRTYTIKDAMKETGLSRQRINQAITLYGIGEKNRFFRWMLNKKEIAYIIERKGKLGKNSLKNSKKK